MKLLLAWQHGRISKRYISDGEWRLALASGPAQNRQLLARSAARKVVAGNVEGWKGIEGLTYARALAAVSNPYVVNQSICGPMAHLFVLGDGALFKALADQVSAVAKAAGKGQAPSDTASCVHFLTLLHARVHDYEPSAAFGPGTYEPLLNMIGEDDDARTVIRCANEAR